MDNAAVLKRLQRLVAAEGNQRKAALKLGITQPYLADILKGYRNPGPRVLQALGLERVITTREVSR